MTSSHNSPPPPHHAKFPKILMTHYCRLSVARKDHKALIIMGHRPLTILRTSCPRSKLVTSICGKCIRIIMSGLSNPLNLLRKVNITLSSTAITIIQARRSLPMASPPNSNPYTSIQILLPPHLPAAARPSCRFGFAKHVSHGHHGSGGRKCAYNRQKTKRKRNHCGFPICVT